MGRILKRKDMIIMYKVKKDEGSHENVYLTNEDTMGVVNLGRPTPAILRALSEEYIIEPFESDRDTYTTPVIFKKDKWDLSINDDTKETLLKIAMPMKKPIRRKVESENVAPEPSEQITTKDGKPVVDILDIIYGLAK